MTPRDTTYRLAHTPQHYALCHALAREQGEAVTLSWPTVMALRGDALFGFVATQPRKDAIVAGPLMVSRAAPRPILIVLRLCEALENVYRAAGVRLYQFHVDRSNRRWNDVLNKAGIERYADDESGTFYRRRIA